MIMKPIVALLFVLSLSIVRGAIPISYPDDWQNTRGDPPYKLLILHPSRHQIIQNYNDTIYTYTNLA